MFAGLEQIQNKNRCSLPGAVAVEPRIALAKAVFSRGPFAFAQALSSRGPAGGRGTGNHEFLPGVVGACRGATEKAQSQQTSEHRRKLTAIKAVEPSGPSAQPLHFGSLHGSFGRPTVLSG